MAERPRRRTCERCGRQIESKQSDVFLCRTCSRDQQAERQRERKGQQALKRSRSREETWDDMTLDALSPRRSPRQGPPPRKTRRSYDYE